MNELEGKRIIVTGGAQGMGREHVRALVSRGARVAILDVDAAAARELLASTPADRVRYYDADVSDRARVDEVVAEVSAAWQGLDAVVSNAGNVQSGESLAETDDDGFWRTFRIHVGGALNLARAAAPALRESGDGRIVIVSSSWAQQPVGFGYGYSAAKGALLSLMRTLAVELGPDGVCVNAVAPGGVPTRMTETKSAASIAIESEAIPLRRWARIDEVSGLVAFLCSNESSYITGQTVGVNGGLIPS